LLRFRYVATSGQTTFSGADAASATLTYTVNNIAVHRNGVTLDTSEYTASNGTSIVLTVAAGTGDIIDIIAFKSFTVADALSAVSGGTVNGAVTITGALTANGNVILGDASTDTLNVGNGGLVKDASGNVGVNATPSAWGSTAKAVQLPNGCAIARLGDGDFVVTQNAYFDNPNFKYASTTGVGSSVYRQIDGTHRWSYAASGTAGNNITFTEAMRIDTSGNLLVGITDSSKGALIVGKAAPSAAYGQICAFSPTAGDSNISGMSIVKYANDSTTAQVLMRFLMNQGGTGQGQINANGANTAAFGSYSDSRLKENIVDLPSQLDNIMALRPVEYDYIESMGGGHQIGFVAQEVQAIYPDLVGENEDGMLTLTDMNKNDARLIKAIQEMKAIIDIQASTIIQLQADVAALKGNA
jgi:hypothetical protein